MKKHIASTIGEFINESNHDYSVWKRKNVTIRGIKEFGKDNEVHGSFGKGLYTVPLSNKSMAKQYGRIYFVVNAIPKSAKIVDSLNNAELWRQKLINDYCVRNNQEYSVKFFESNTSIEKEMTDIGYDGLIIKGREMVNYNPENVKYFDNEIELQAYYNSI